MRLVRYALYIWRKSTGDQSSVFGVVTRHVLSVAPGVDLFLLCTDHACVVHSFVAVGDVVGNPACFGVDIHARHGFGQTLLSLSLYLSLDLLLHALLPLVCLLVDLVLVARFELTQASAFTCSKTMIRTSLLEGSQFLFHPLSSRDLLLYTSLLGCNLDLHQLVPGE